MLKSGVEVSVKPRSDPSVGAVAMMRHWCSVAIAIRSVAKRLVASVFGPAGSETAAHMMLWLSGGGLRCPVNGDPCAGVWLCCEHRRVLRDTREDSEGALVCHKPGRFAFEDRRRSCSSPHGVARRPKSMTIRKEEKCKGRNR